MVAYDTGLWREVEYNAMLLCWTRPQRISLVKYPASIALAQKKGKRLSFCLCLYWTANEPLGQVCYLKDGK